MTPLPAGPPRAEQRLDHPQGCHGVGVEHRPESLDREVLERPRAGHAGVVDHGVELAGRRQRVGDRRRVAHVEGQHLGHVQVGEQARVPGRGHHVVAPVGQLDGGGPTDRPGGAGDEDTHAAECRDRPGPGQAPAGSPTSCSLTSHNRRAASGSRAAAVGCCSLHFTKYLPVVVATSGEVAR